jgi:hypothetical protein
MNPEDCPIVDDFCVRLNYGDGDYTLASPSTDIIMRYTVPDYDHLRLWEADEKVMKAMFISQTLLAQLVEVGIPESEIQETIPEGVYLLWQQAKDDEDEAEDRNIFGVEESEHMPLTDAEIEFYLNHEWKDDGR